MLLRIAQLLVVALFATWCSGQVVLPQWEPQEVQSLDGIALVQVLPDGLGNAWKMGHVRKEAAAFQNTAVEEKTAVALDKEDASFRKYLQTSVQDVDTGIFRVTFGGLGTSAGVDVLVDCLSHTISMNSHGSVISDKLRMSLAALGAGDSNDESLTMAKKTQVRTRPCNQRHIIRKVAAYISTAPDWLTLDFFPDGNVSKGPNSTYVKCLTEGEHVKARWNDKTGVHEKSIMVGSEAGPKYGCMGNCGPDCSKHPVYTQDCLNHDQCSWENNSTGGLMNADCGDEWSQAVDDYVFATCNEKGALHTFGLDQDKMKHQKVAKEEDKEVEEVKSDPAIEETVALVQNENETMSLKGDRSDKDRKKKEQKDNVKNKIKKNTKAEVKKQLNEKSKVKDKQKNKVKPEILVSSNSSLKSGEEGNVSNTQVNKANTSKSSMPKEVVSEEEVVPITNSTETKKQ